MTMSGFELLIFLVLGIVLGHFGYGWLKTGLICGLVAMALQFLGMDVTSWILFLLPLLNLIIWAQLIGAFIVYFLAGALGGAIGNMLRSKEK